MALDPSLPLILALDFGGTKHTAALVRPGERVWLDRRRAFAPKGANGAVDRQMVVALARKMLGDHPGRLSAVGVSFGGPVDFDRGVVRLSHHVPGWEEFPLRDHLRSEFGVPTVVDNDANAGALGEWAYGAGQGCASLFYITVSTGVGGGWIIDGEVYRGAQGMAGEIGHTIVDPNGPVCVCGRRGCVEILACGPAIARRARERLTADPGGGKILRELMLGNPTNVTAELVSRAAVNGDTLAEEVLVGAAADLGSGIGNAVSLMNPQRVVLGGGVIKAGAKYLAAVQRAAQGNTLPEIWAEIVAAALEDDAPLWGAVALAEGLTG